MTHRQYVVWQAWLREEWNHPDRHDNYMMQVAAELRRLPNRFPFAARMNDIRHEHFKIPFSWVPREPALTKEQDLENYKKLSLAIAMRSGPRPPRKK